MGQESKQLFVFVVIIFLLEEKDLLHVTTLTVCLSFNPCEVEPWFHSWYRGRVETARFSYFFVDCLCGHVKCNHGFILGTVVGYETLDAKYFW